MAEGRQNSRIQRRRNNDYSVNSLLIPQIHNPEAEIIIDLSTITIVADAILTLTGTQSGTVPHRRQATT